jgi:tRNA pseudouridine38-40 synthase
MNKPVDPSVDGFIRYRIDLAYDGTNYWGFAAQRKHRTVQGELLKALTTVFGKSKTSFDMRVAGRTDAGVHATAQVVHIDLTPTQLKRLGRTVGMMGSLNDLLPEDIRIHSVTEAPSGFDARYSASFRRYRYTIADKLAPKNPLLARSTLWIKHELDLLQMQASALGLLGLHDYASFCRPKLGATTIREVRELTVKRNPAAGNVIEVEIMADAFCHNMVRAIVGALIAAGEHKTTPDGVIKRLEKRSRIGSFKVQPPHGLTLIEVGYPSDDKLAAQAEMAKNMRTLDESED